MAVNRSFEDRSSSAKKGWATRRQREVERGERTPESYEEIYGHSYEESTSDWWNDWFEEKTPNTEPVTDTDEVEDYDIDEDDYEDDLDLYHEELIDRLYQFSGSAQEMTEQTIAKLIELYKKDPKTYLKNLKDNKELIDGCFIEITSTSNLYEVFVAFGDIIEFASGGEISSTAWQATIRQSRRNDMFNAYHTKKPNARYYKRKSQV